MRELLGDSVGELRVETRRLHVTHFASGSEFRDYFKANYGPTIAVYAYLADRPDQIEALDRALVDLGDRFDLGGGAMEWEYVLISASRADA